jgi:hypothetical protein
MYQRLILTKEERNLSLSLSVYMACEKAKVSEIFYLTSRERTKKKRSHFIY